MKNLADAGDSSVSVQHFHRRYFPVPGCVLDGIVFRHGPAGRTFITIRKLSIQGSYLKLLRHHVPRITAESVRVFIAPFGSNETFNTHFSDTVVDEFLVRDGVVEFSPKPQKEPSRFLVHEASFHDLKSGRPFSYSIKLRNPNPPGEITASGHFGAFHQAQAGDTPFSGEYTFEHADLSIYQGIAGTLTAHGRFNGTLSQLNVEGGTNIPNFAVRLSGYAVHLSTQFAAYVDATNGDTFLNHVEAHWGGTTLNARGSVASRNGHKVGKFYFSAEQARIEDLLGLFVKRGRSPLTGPVTLNAATEIPAGNESFLDKVVLKGTFEIQKGAFSKSETQVDVDKLSAGARGQKKDDPERVLTDLKGQVALEKGVAKFLQIKFEVPGAHARLHGNYNLDSHRVNLHGRMKVQSQISNTTSGVKSFLLKMMDPFFKKRKHGEIVPVHIQGTYEHPNFGLDLKQ